MPWGRKTVYSGDYEPTGAEIQQARDFAAMRGEPFSMTGISSSYTMADRLREGQKDRKEFLKRIGEELAEAKKTNKKATEADALKAVQKKYPKFRKWKKK